MVTPFRYLTPHYLRFMVTPFSILDLRLMVTPFGILDLRLMVTPFSILDLRFMVTPFSILDLRFLVTSILDLFMVTPLVSKIYGLWLPPLVS